MLTFTLEEEKKLLSSLLSKLHISPASTPEKLREVYATIAAAIDDKLVTDATSRNALYKIHVSLGKIVNAMDESGQRGPNEKTVIAGEEIVDEDSGTGVGEAIDMDDGVAEGKAGSDSLVNDLLKDDEDDI